ncbi:hypothetical protein GCM10009118_23240 [Wandonia haliotis]|uniref:Serine protease n=1 Tax=Wandonia haliotis TaxID=574963 RepID=A0ABN1MRQ1_9FLAO
MMDFFNQFEPLLRTFWFIAIPASLIFLVQTVLTFIGSDASDGLNADFDGDMSADSDGPFQLFSLRNLINFLLGFGWGGISFWNSIENKTILILVAAVIGLVFLFLFFFIIRQIQKLQEDNSFHISKTLHKTGTVYLRIPENKTGVGKVQVSVNGSVHELNAVTSGVTLESGSVIRVLEVVDDNLLLVEKL